MNYCKRLLVAISFFVLGWVCLIFAAGGMPENPANLADTQGLPAVAIYAGILQATGIIAVLMSGVGIIISAKRTCYSFRVKIVVFIASNTLIILASLLGILIIAAYVLDTLLGVIGLVLYLFVLVLVVSSAPRRDKRMPQ